MILLIYFLFVMAYFFINTLILFACLRNITFRSGWAIIAAGMPLLISLWLAPESRLSKWWEDLE